MINTPKISLKLKAIFSVPNNPSASIIAAESNWATKIMAIPNVAPIELMLFTTVNVIITPIIPPKRKSLLTSFIAL